MKKTFYRLCHHGHSVDSLIPIFPKQFHPFLRTKLIHLVTTSPLSRILKNNLSTSNYLSTLPIHNKKHFMKLLIIPSFNRIMPNTLMNLKHSTLPTARLILMDSKFVTQKTKTLVAFYHLGNFGSGTSLLITISTTLERMKVLVSMKVITHYVTYPLPSFYT